MITHVYLATLFKMCGVLPPLHLRALHLHFSPSGMVPLQHEPKRAPKKQQRSPTKTEFKYKWGDKITGCTKTGELEHTVKFLYKTKFKWKYRGNRIKPSERTKNGIIMRTGDKNTYNTQCTINYIPQIVRLIRTCVNHKELVVNRHIPGNTNLKLNT